MQNEFANRQNMHLTVINLLENPQYQAAWQGQAPTAFASRAALLIPKVRARQIKAPPASARNGSIARLTEYQPS